ncbi:partial TPR repeat-containing protein YrrB, partial [Anaerolineae bacterium]
MPGRIEKTVFISYRRTNFYTALAVYQDLTAHGYDAFFDYQSIDSGNFEKVILENIESHVHFVVILSPSALERCSEPGDWLRREIEAAIELKRNIVPLMMEGFDFGSPTTIQALSGNLAMLNTYNGLRLYADYFFDAMEKLRTRFLNVALEDTRSREVSAETRLASKTTKSLAKEAPQVESQQLTAEQWFERAYSLQEAKNFDEAIRCYTEALRLEPDLDAAHNNLGIILSDLKRNDEAEAAYRKAIELNPSYATAYNNLGLLFHENLKRYDDAKSAFYKAIELDPLYATTYYNLGNLLSDENLKCYEDAEVAYCKAIELNPSHATAYYNLGNLLQSLNRYDDAEAAYHKAIEINPSYTTAYNNLGNLLSNENLKRYSDAEAAYRKAIELSKAFPSGDMSLDIAYINLGQLYFDQGKWQEAITVLTDAIRVNPDSAKLYRQRGLVYQILENLELAQQDFKQAIKLQPDDGLTQMSLFGLLKKIGKDDEAREHEVRARKFAKSDTEYNQACFEVLCGNTEESLN